MLFEEKNKNDVENPDAQIERKKLFRKNSENYPM
jgi:hypothetical protein